MESWVVHQLMDGLGECLWLPGDDDQKGRGTGRNSWKTGLPNPAPPLPSSPEMMGHPDLLPEVDVSALDPLMSSELVDQTERRYVMKVKVSEQDGDSH